MIIKIFQVYFINYFLLIFYVNILIKYYQKRIENNVGKKVTPVTHPVNSMCNQNSNYTI